MQQYILLQLPGKFTNKAGRIRDTLYVRGRGIIEKVHNSSRCGEFAGRSSNVAGLSTRALSRPFPHAACNYVLNTLGEKSPPIRIPALSLASINKLAAVHGEISSR